MAKSKVFFYLDSADKVIRSVKVTKLIIADRLKTSCNSLNWVIDSFVGYTTDNRTERDLTSEFKSVVLYLTADDCIKDKNGYCVVENDKRFNHLALEYLFNDKTISFHPNVPMMVRFDNGFTTTCRGMTKTCEITAFMWDGVKPKQIVLDPKIYVYDVLSSTFIFNKGLNANPIWDAFSKTTFNNTDEVLSIYSSFEECEKDNSIKIETFDDEEFYIQENVCGYRIYKVKAKNLSQAIEIAKNGEGEIYEENVYSSSVELADNFER